MPIRRLLQYDFRLVFKVTRVLEKINSKVLHLGAAKMSQWVKRAHCASTRTRILRTNGHQLCLATHVHT